MLEMQFFKEARFSSHEFDLDRIAVFRDDLPDRFFQDHIDILRPVDRTGKANLDLVVGFFFVDAVQ